VAEVFLGIHPDRWAEIRHEVGRRTLDVDVEVKTGGYRF